MYNGIIEIPTKYLKIDPYPSNKIEKSLYTMKINCFTFKFKDISVNGKKKFNSEMGRPPWG